ncbi:MULTISPECIES: S41 family peptidase [unclassified Arsukibacterium]|uniref:S41 family peptidase n=1 Tax=unclassified Arsukibacterium TaxID=2635278 RepID=UPI000C4BAC02|nr:MULTISPECIES: S41 family peptidase [unclassified Arsukibacterium]MAA95566.1 peptidase [Rheinheimera sp.]MBM32968.1 peptidase [Rheinheimera sp.]|tara:strand:- start:883 stop:2529 length:1647 start_codon:yes stop_codon:yes gene_type:complete
MFKRSLLISSVILLTACGGGGSGNIGSGGGSGGGGSGGGSGVTPPTWTPGVFAAESNFKNYCATPRTGTDPYNDNQPYPDRAGTTMHEKMWLRSWSNNTYLWYRELPDNNPANFNTVTAFFDQLKTDELTDSGAEKDNFHFSQNTASYKQQTQSGVTSGYGISWSFGSTRPPRSLLVAYTEPDSPAANANILRGADLVEVDGVDFVNDNTNAGVNAINAALFPQSAGEQHEFVFITNDGNTLTVTLTSADVASSPVQNVQILETDAGKVGYLQFNSHIALAQSQLINAVNSFANANVNEVVLDLRYNGGGLLALASQFAYMVSGDAIIQDRIFEQTVFNDKYPNRDPVTGQTLSPMPFYGFEIDYEGGRLTNTPLPELNLNRIFVLSTGDTCSASEAFINGLRGIDVEVILIGDQTCGKPYGFYPTDNCGTTYFTIQFSGVNAKGFGQYADGFYPTPVPTFAADVKGCQVADDFSAQLGDPNENMLASALHYATFDNCPLGVAGQSLSQSQRQDDGSGLSIHRHNPRMEAFLLEDKINQPIKPAQDKH